MSLHINGQNVAEAWLKGYEALAKRRHDEAVNMTVTVDNPGLEILGVRQSIDSEVARLQATGKRDFNKSVHTVANTIFPISLYREGRPEAFYEAAVTGQSGRKGTITSWGHNSGTYIGRLLQYPTYGGERFNQISRMLENLDARLNFQDSYEMSLTCEPPDADPDTPTLFASASTFVPAYDNSHRGGQCLSHISLNRSPQGALSMVALYRHQTYLTRAYGNFLGLSRLLHFLVRESRKDLHVGELMMGPQLAGGDWVIHTSAPEVLHALWSKLDSPLGLNGRLRVGIDVVEVEVIARQLEGELGHRFMTRTFTPAEIEDSRGRADRFASRWAVKEAVAKAIGTGFREGLRPSSIEVVTAPSGAVSVQPARAATWPHVAADWAWAVSATHESGFASAIALAVSPQQSEREVHA
jgi:phosphopantetheine--protein transferase-like protein